MGAFENLSPLDFEELVAELLEAETSIPFRSGASGPDKGLDLVGYTGADLDELHVVQCKHYENSTFSHLRAAAKAEANRFECAGMGEFASYRFVTSRRLSHENRRELIQILEPWTVGECQIIVAADINRMLRAHPEIEARHPKLWLTSTAQLHGALNAATRERSSMLLAEIRRFMPVCVETSSYFEARHMLKEEKVCIISGGPGTGKTTIGRLLVLDAARAGFQPYEVLPETLNEAWRLLQLDERQIFFFDDFLGQTALEGSRRGDSDIARFMRRIADDPNRQLVMTTREYILREAKQLSDVLEREINDHLKVILPLNGYDQLERARIFYNHVYFSPELDALARRSLLEGRGYMRVIDHPAYNPRLIEWMTGWSAARANHGDGTDYLAHCLEVLEYPERVWSHAFEQGLDDWSRALLFSLLGMPRRTAYADLEAIFTSACLVRGLETTGRRLHHAVDALEGSFLGLTWDEEEDQHFVEFANPAVVDFLVSYLRESVPDAAQVFEGALYFEQVDWLWAQIGDDRTTSLALRGYRRAFDRDPAIGHEGTMYDYPGDVSFQATDRFTTFAERCLHSPEWADRKDDVPWIREQTQAWFDQLVDGVLATRDDIEMTAILLQQGALVDPEAGRKLRGLLSQSPEDVYRWMSVADLREQMPEAMPDGEWKVERQAFLSYAARALRRPSFYLGGAQQLREFCETAPRLEVELDPDLISEAEGKLGIESEEARQFSEPTLVRRNRVEFDENDEIVSMFNTIRDHPEDG